MSFTHKGGAHRTLEILSHYIPHTVLQQLHQFAGPTVVESTSSLSDILGTAALFADASGFTALTEKLSTYPNGAELMCQAINGFLTLVIDCVHKHGGDIVKFAGDAVSAIFPLRGLDGGANSMEVVVHRATACAIEMHQRVHGYTAWRDPTGAEPPITLSLHVGVGCGLATMLHLGTTRCEVCFAGPALLQSATAEPLASSGETCVSPEAWAYLDGIATGRAVEAAEGAESYMLVETLASVTLPPALASPRGSRGSIRRSVGSGAVRSSRPSLLGFRNHERINPTPTLTLAMMPYMRRYVPLAIALKADAGRAGTSEMRHVSVMFVNLGGLNLVAQTDDDLVEAHARGNAAFHSVRDAVYSREGQLNKMLVDDKGTVLLCVFGLPPRPHADDPLRSVKASMAISRALDGHCSQEGGGRVPTACVGVATGRVFCGVVGSAERSEFTTMGDTVNVAARLMGLAKRGIDESGQPNGAPRLVVDESSMTFTSDEVTYRALPPVALKGKKGLRYTYEPLSLTPTSQSGGSVGRKGRDQEYVQLRGFIGELLTYHGGGTIVLLGSHGSGKSALVPALATHGAAAHMRVLQGSATRSEEFGSFSVQGQMRKLRILASGRRLTSGLVRSSRQELAPTRHDDSWGAQVAENAAAEMATPSPPPSVLSLVAAGDGNVVVAKPAKLKPITPTSAAHTAWKRLEAHTDHAGVHAAEVDRALQLEPFGAWKQIVRQLLEAGAHDHGVSATEFVRAALVEDSKEVARLGSQGQADGPPATGSRAAAATAAGAMATAAAAANRLRMAAWLQLAEARQSNLLENAWLLGELLDDSSADQEDGDVGAKGTSDGAPAAAEGGTGGARPGLVLEFARPEHAESVEQVGWPLMAILLALFKHYCRVSERRLLVLPILQPLNADDLDSSVDLWSWRLTSFLSELAERGQVTRMVVCVATRRLRLVHSGRMGEGETTSKHENEAHFQALVEMARRTATLMSLQPLDKDARDRYLHQVLTERHDFRGGPEGVPEVLRLVMSERAAGHPTHIEDLLKSMLEHSAVQLEEHHNHGQRLIVQPLAKLRGVPIPPQMEATLLQQFDALPALLQSMLKRVSVLDAFSESMLAALGLEVEARERTAHLLSIAVSEGLLEVVTPIPAEVLEADPSATKAWRWLQMLMKDEISSNVLAADKVRVLSQVAQLKRYHADMESRVERARSALHRFHVSTANTNGGTSQHASQPSSARSNGKRRSSAGLSSFFGSRRKFSTSTNSSPSTPATSFSRREVAKLTDVGELKQQLYAAIERAEQAERRLRENEVREMRPSKIGRLLRLVRL